jgi:hypothetical protein
MSILRNPRHEAGAQALAAFKSNAEAAIAAGFDAAGTSFESNARKFANRKDIRRRVVEIQRRGAEMAEVEAGFIILGLRDLLRYNLDDFLTKAEFDEKGNVTKRRRLDIDRATREQLERIEEFATEPRKHGWFMKIRGYSRLAVYAQLARAIGIDKDPTADALTGIGDRLAAAMRRLGGADAA